MADPIIIRNDPGAGQASMPLDLFIATFGQPGDSDTNYAAIRAELQRRGLLRNGSVDPNLAYGVLGYIRTRSAIAAPPPPPKPNTRKPKPKARSLDTLLALGLDSDSPGITDAEADILYQHERNELITARLRRNGHYSGGN